jgi:hypothetical protein
MVLGVSTRRYARSLEPLPSAIAARGTSKSAMSERLVYGTERKLAGLMSRDLHLCVAKYNSGGGRGLKEAIAVFSPAV